MPPDHRSTSLERQSAKPYDRPAPSTEQGKTLRVDPEWTEGDFTLVSSNGRAFRIPSYYLFSARYVGEAVGALG